MKTPFQAETRGIMISGDSPAPSAHGDHLYEPETVIISQPHESKTMSDKAVQKNSSDSAYEPTENSSNVSHHSLANQDNPGFEMSDFSSVKIPGERRSVELEDEICPDEDMSSACSTSKVKAAKSDDVMKSDEIETVADQTDNPSPMKCTVNHPQEEDSCLINCLFYLDECCTCTVL